MSAEDPSGLFSCVVIWVLGHDLEQSIKVVFAPQCIQSANRFVAGEGVSVLQKGENCAMRLRVTEPGGSLDC